LKQRAKTVAPEKTRLTAPREPLPPYPLNLMGVPSQSTAIACDSVIGIVAPHRLAQMAMLFGDVQMQVMPAPVGHRCHRTSKTALRRQLLDHILSLSRLAPDVREAEEVESGPACCAVAHAVGPLEAKVDEACLVGMQRQAVSRKTLAQHGQDPLGAEEVLKRHH